MDLLYIINTLILLALPIFYFVLKKAIEHSFNVKFESLKKNLQEDTEFLKYELNKLEKKYEIVLESQIKFKEK